jgi:hypothetical protein
MLEYLISGHSSSTDKVFAIPKNISLVFYAEQNQTCYVPYDKESLDIAINSMSHYRTHNSGEQVEDYPISFTRQMFEGMSKIERNPNNEIQDYNFFIPTNDEIELSKVCELLKNHYSGDIKLYCIFCRGSEREFRDEYGDFQGVNVDKLFADEAMDEDFAIGHNEIMNNNEMIGNNEFDDFELNLDMFKGGKRKTKRRKSVRRKTLRKKASRRKMPRRKTLRRRHK